MKTFAKGDLVVCLDPKAKGQVHFPLKGAVVVARTSPQGKFLGFDGAPGMWSADRFEACP